MDPGKPALPSRELEAFIGLLDKLLSVPRDKIQAELRRAHGMKAAFGKVGLKDAQSQNPPRRDT